MAAHRRGQEYDPESGFTLIELLIVIVVLGILAATVVFALGGVTSKSAVSACNSDAKSYQVAIAAYESNNNGALPTNTAALTTGGVDAPLHAAANNPNYVVAIGGDTGANNWGATAWSVSTVPTTADGNVYVGLPGKPLVNYDSQVTGTSGCSLA